MEDDNLEKFIHKNRSQFDSEEPRNSVWDQIESGLGRSDSTAKIDYSWMWKVAASVLFLLSAYLIYDRNNIMQDVAENSNELAIDTQRNEFIGAIQRPSVK